MIIIGSSRNGSKVSSNEKEAIGHAMCAREREWYAKPEENRWIFVSID